MTSKLAWQFMGSLWAVYGQFYRTDEIFGLTISASIEIA